jgi:hypothetical protein
MKKRNVPVCSNIGRISRSVWPLAAFVILTLFSGAAQAQFIRFRSSPVGVTVPLNTNQSFVLTNLVNVSGLSNSYTALNVSGLPAGASATLTADTNGTALGTITNNTAVILNLTANNVGEGLYSFNINGSGIDTNGNPVTGLLLLRLQVGYVWNGTTNVGTTGPGNWSDSANWLWSVAGSKPGDAPGHDVIFTDLGGQTNFGIWTNLSGPVFTNLLTNTIITADTTVASVRFAQTNNSSAFHCIAIAPGKTLSVTGTNGFSFQRDYISEFAGLGTRMNVTITGTNGTMVVSNPKANIATMLDNQQNLTLDMSGLGTFTANVNRVALGDYSAWPNYFNLLTNNYPNNGPRRYVPLVNLARTNSITASYSDPDNYTNASSRDYSLAVSGSGASGTTTQGFLRMGVSNAFFVDSIVFAHGGQQANLVFLTTSNNFAYFRGTNGGRMSMFALADQGGDNTNQVTSNCKGTVDFTGGTVDVLVDRFYLGRDRVLMGQGQAQGAMTIARGTIDANEMILGFQEHPGQTNTQTYCTGTLTVTNTAVVKVNTDLILGYTSETNVGTGSLQVSDTALNNGRVNIGPGGTVMANNILVGGPKKLSVNQILVANGGTLVVSNTLADPSKALDTLQFNSGSTNVLHVDCNNTTTPLEYATTLNMSGASSIIKIGAVKNLAAVEVPLIFYTNGSANFAGQAIMPPPPVGIAALNGVLRKDETAVPHVLYLDILTNAPKNLAWRGTGTTANWNATSKNWADLNNGGVMTNFVNGDTVIFDDTPGLASTVVITDVGMIPGSITMTNSTYNYVFSAGGGTLEGTALWNKWGSNPLEIDAPTTVSVLVNQGSLTGTGNVGPVTIAAGSTMSFSGNIVGGIGCAGTAVLAGTDSGTVSLNGGTGIFTNMGSITGLVSLGTNTTFVNGHSINFIGLGTCNLSSNSLFINNATITGDGFSVGGRFEDAGAANITLRETIDFNSGSLFIPGGNSTNGTTTFYPNGDLTHTNAARVTFHNGSTVIFAVDPITGANTMVLSGKQAFGDNPSGQTPGQFGCTLVISNVTGAPFVNGQVFPLCQYAFGGDIIGTGIATNAYPIISPNVPVPPGAGLSWDISQITKTGKLGVFGLSTTPVTLDKSFTFQTNNVQIGTNTFLTNTLVTHLTWPSDHTGYSVWQQSNPGTVGLSTNWSIIFYSFTNNELYLTNIVTNLQDCTFFRLQYPPFPPQSQ